MGMCLGIMSADDESIRRVLADPPLVWQLLAPDEPSLYEQERARQSSWFSRLFGKRKASSEVEDVDAAPLRPIEDTDLDKAWHGIHYLLTGTAWEGDSPRNFLVLGGTEVGDIDVGYGRARAFDSQAVKEISRSLAAIDREELHRRYDPVRMTELEIYPGIWDEDVEEEETIGYCLEYFDELKEFIARTAEKDLGMVIAIQ